jgi:hypothetical protein
MSPGTQNMKSGLYALVTIENESGRAKHENETRHPRYVENESGSAKQEKETRRTRYRRKRVRERKI